MSDYSSKMTKKLRQDSGDSLEDQEPPASTGMLPKKQRRTARACDRCRVKRVKCDGMARCQPCIKSDSPCLYTHQRHSASKKYHWQMRDAMNEALRRLFIACKNGSGFPGRMPAGSEGEDENISVQAILEGLGLIPSPGAESPPYGALDGDDVASLDAKNKNWHVDEVSDSATPTQSPGDMAPSTFQGHLPSSLTSQCENSYDRVGPTGGMIPAARQKHDPEETTDLRPKQLENRIPSASYSADSFRVVATGTQAYQTPAYYGHLNNETPPWMESNLPPPSGSYQYSYSY